MNGRRFVIVSIRFYAPHILGRADDIRPYDSAIIIMRCFFQQALIIASMTALKILFQKSLKNHFSLSMKPFLTLTA